jgi:selenide,water dikinase
MNPFPARLTLVVDDPVAVYSGMVPGLVAGQYDPHELEIDVRPLARRAGVRVIGARLERVDAERRALHVAGRPPIRYDLASLNIGSTVAGQDVPGVREHALPTRPIATLVAELDTRLAGLPAQPRIVVVGAGAGGIELAFCLEQRLRASGSHPHVTLVAASDRPLPGRHGRIAGRVEDAARRRGIPIRTNTRVVRVGASEVELDDGATLPADLTVWAAGAAAHDVARNSGLPTDDRGFIRIESDLRVEGHTDLFAVGDCAVPIAHPTLPRAGVYAVREGPVLADNLRALLERRPLSDYVPQSDFFGILNLGDGTAIGMKWGLPVEGRLVMRWKDRIDRKFMDRFQVLDPSGAPREAFLEGMPAMEEMDAPCGGCAAKVGQRPLEQALSRLEPTPSDPGRTVVLGTDAADDVVAWRASPGGPVAVQNLDAFTAFTDDPWLVGRVAAENACSDVYAKGIVPQAAMAFVQVPADEPDREELLFQVMSGVRHALDAAQIDLLGGHTMLGPDASPLVVGLSVTAHTDAPDALWTLDGARVGDALMLSRPLGTGVLFHADMAGRAAGRHVHAALSRMQRGNRSAMQELTEAVGSEVHACTDITGFGLAGHLGEMLRASGVSATLSLDALPALPGVLALLAAGERSTFHDDNRRPAGLFLGEGTVRHPAFELLFDPQTAGGLLAAVPEGTALPGWSRIGTVTASRSDGAAFAVHCER